MKAIPACVLLLAGAAVASIPLPSAASWTSSDSDFSTGAAFADVNGDGYLDLCTSNGNDMAQDHNGAYLNSVGMLDTVASWRSTDTGYFGHCYAGDVNNDGLPDLAVAYLGNYGNGDHHARVYVNEGAGLGTAPAWTARDRHSSFDCCLGDLDLDGDLDLAVAAGDAYSPVEYDRARVYRNNAGVFDTLPFWTASDSNPSDAVRFADVDDDGDLDLFVGQVIPNSDGGKVSMYRNNGGVLETTPSWTARAGVGWVLRLAFGDYDNDGFQDLAVASNDQLGEPNSVKVFHNNAGTLDTLAAFTMLRNMTYSSCVAWADVNGDGFADLAAGGWWEPAVVFENHAGTLDTLPSWSWSPPNPGDLVCETVVWADVRNSHLASADDAFDGTGARKLYSFLHRPVQFLDSVTVGGVRVPVAGFCSDPLGGWVSLSSAPPAGSENVRVYYRYSQCPDLAVTNWTSNRGNYLFLNTTPVAVAEGRGTPARSGPVLVANPNPFSGMTSIRLDASLITHDPLPMTHDALLTITDAAGRLVRTLRASSVEHQASSVVWDGTDDAGRPTSPGVYFATAGISRAGTKLVKLGIN
jgi:hypothetical protein